MFRRYLGLGAADSADDEDSDGQQERAEATTEYDIQSTERYQAHASFGTAQCQQCGEVGCSCKAGDGDPPWSDSELLAASYVAREVGLADSRGLGEGTEAVLEMEDHWKNMLVATLDRDAVGGWADLVAIADEVSESATEPSGGESGAGSVPEEQARYLHDGGVPTSEAAALRASLTEQTPLTDADLSGYTETQLVAIHRAVEDPAQPVGGEHMAVATGNGRAGRREAYVQMAARAAEHAGYVGRGWAQSQREEEQASAEDDDTDDTGGQHQAHTRRAPAVNYSGQSPAPVSGGSDDDGYLGRGVFQSMREAEDGD